MLPARADYPLILQAIREAPKDESIDRMRQACREDLYFLLRYALGRADADNDFVFERCREVQANPDGHLDLWAREHYKSTIITFAQTIRDILTDPELTVGIFSHTRGIAKAFLRQIKREFESNEVLRKAFPDILWANTRDAPKWTEDEGIIVKRKGNPVPATVEAWGLVDGQPIGRHFGLMVYDDVVVPESVTTPDMIAKTTGAWELSRNLTSEGGRTRYIGTRYHFNDTYRVIMEREAATPRIYPATLDGTVEGEPRMMSKARLVEKRREMGPYTFSCQMLQNPVADDAQGFREDWLQFYPGNEFSVRQAAQQCNVYMLVDAANEKKKGSDYTAIMVLGLHENGSIYWLDGVRDRLNLTERADRVMALHRKWRPNAVGYERYGIMADVQYLRERMNAEGYHFRIIELGGPQPKPDRIRRLVPWFEQRKVWLPDAMKRTDYEGRAVDLVRAFVEEEYKAFPVAVHDDMLDAASRLLDEDFPAVWPREEEEWEDEWERDRGRSAATGY